jgi:DNA-binding transcriptional MerR regulator/effector-binding domain-containing protein
MLSIGEFSKVTGLTVKTLRHYHDEGLLAPAFVDRQTGYRYYDLAQAEGARAIAFLRGLEFSLDDIRALLRERDNDEALLDAMERQRAALAERVKHLRRAVRSLDEFISEERRAMAMTQSTYKVEEKVLGPVRVAGVRMTGRYSDCGRGFGRIGRKFGRFICGKPMLLHYDAEYKAADADFEACMPVRPAATATATATDGIVVRELPGGRCVSLMHRGPYDQLGRAYAEAFRYVSDKGYAVTLPTREVYHNGPGMIFKGNPKNYLTEIQLPIGGANGGAS